MEIQNEQSSEPAGAERAFPSVPLNTASTASIFIVLLFGIGAITITQASFLENPKTQVVAAAAAPNPYADITLTAKSAIVVDLTSGEALFALNPDSQLPLASLTKIALVLAVSEALPLNSVLPITQDITSARGSPLLSKGEVWRVQDIIDVVLMASSNDGAEFLAKIAGDSLRERFPEAPDSATLWRMNELTRELEALRTYFLNVNGLDISNTLAGGYGSARDMATLFIHAFKTNPAVFSGTARREISLVSAEGHETIIRNTNEIEGVIPGLIMGKTGFTDLAGGNLAVIFDIGIAHPAVAVVLGSTQEGRFEDMKKLVEAARATIASE